MFDVLALGAVAIDQLVYVDAYPPPNVKSRVNRAETQCGGLSATALVAAARLGAKCAYAGTLGNDDASRFVKDAMSHDGIDLSHVVTQEGAGPIRSIIIVGAQGNTRNIFPHHPQFTGAHPTLPDPATIRNARVLHVDHVGLDGMIRAAQIAREASIPIVSDLERTDGRAPELLALVDHLVMSHEFSSKLLGEVDPMAVARRMWTAARRVVVVTAGEAGAYFTEDGITVLHQSAFPVRVVDTTGCGDVFHGAYSAGLAKGLRLAERVQLASAAAALKATRPGAQAGAPTWSEVAAMLSA
jgi:ribokinase